MADKQLRLKLYSGVSGPVAYDRLGRCWATRKEGDRVVPIGLHEHWEIVDRFDAPKKKADT